MFIHIILDDNKELYNKYIYQITFLETGGDFWILNIWQIITVYYRQLSVVDFLKCDAIFLIIERFQKRWLRVPYLIVRHSQIF